MGTHGRGGFERLFLGSVTERVLRTTHVPVLTVPPPVERVGSVVYKTIVCPIEFSDPSTRALEYALSLAEEADASLIDQNGATDVLLGGAGGLTILFNRENRLEPLALTSTDGRVATLVDFENRALTDRSSISRIRSLVPLPSMPYSPA